MTIDEKDLKLLLDNINENMKRYQEDIEVKMQQSDRVEMEMYRVKSDNAAMFLEAYSAFE